MNKILLKDLISIDILILVNRFDLNKKQPSSVTQNWFEQYFRDFGGSGENLPGYYWCYNI